MSMLTCLEKLISRKGLIYLIFNLLIGPGLFAQVDDKRILVKVRLDDYFQFLHPFDSSITSDLNEFENHVNHNLSRLKRRYHHDQDLLLKQLFYRFHRMYLKHYDDYPSFEKLISAGTYNCLTGTILYAIALKYLGFDYAIYETAFHTYLVINLNNDKRILFESTDPVEGLVTNESQITQLEQKYRSLKIAPWDLNRLIMEQASYANSYQKQITLQQLAGLHYYNLCVADLRQGELQNALEKLKWAALFYPSSKRISNLKQVITNSIIPNPLTLNE